MKHEEQEIHYRVCQSGNTTEDSRKNKQTNKLGHQRLYHLS